MSDFRKSGNSKTEVVIINKIQFRDNYGKIDDNKLASLIEKESRKRKNMRLSLIQNMDWGADRNYFVAFMLIFEERDETLTSIKQELAEIKQKIDDIHGKIY